VGLEDEFDSFVRIHGPSLLRAGWLLTGDWGEAQDLVQIALERVWPRWADLTGEAHRTAYVHRVLTTSFLRSRRRRWRGELPSARLPEHAGPDDVDRLDTRLSLLTAVHLLPARQRAVLTWRFFADLTEAQTAQAMGCSIGTVKSYTSRALNTLRTQPGILDLLTNGTHHDRS
jgi:RNA polymerase sigma-70 factor (sigma-E family)